MQQVDFYYDVVSPYSYLAAIQMESLAAETGVQVVWKPIFLGGLFKQLGNSAPLTNLPKKHYMLTQDLPRLARFYQVAYTRPDVFPANTLLVQRALAAAPVEQRPALSLKLYDFYWGQGQDVAPPEVAEALLGTDIAALGQTETAKATLKALTDELIERGGFGAPTLIWQDQLYFGADRVQLLKADLLATKG
ncbi:2-hydroxychromene-2-carboxylate isomerase [Marinospirillum alkaliphilum]|uniref:2-hydroxychromene-2-carboxylate isomerase n=1 Tax=Marinospirillum alkaliphilum DSM 21637 TaxID=1122209 RepID=A0A1K1TC98_9GAMM|nr:2-hydroxychromene-2-carboxylate isomerase [Marinospirillum alkaliphilum]SFW98255.1 2-hydroxychromene-2-carboxylate isomerase [Marinospirillum alkaliphilum DSM 21637]